MSEREGDKIIEKMREEGKKVYSISRLNTLDQCPYQAYLNYIKGEKGEPNIWAELGGILHEKVQACVDTGCNTKILKEAINDELENLDILGIDFPKDKNGNETIRNNWIANMTRFAEEFKTPKGKFLTEEFVLYKLDDTHYMQGYIDLQRINSDGSLWIVDWKTSSNYSKEHAKEAGRQLVLYGLAKMSQGYTIKKISWCMMKYFEATWTQKNGKDKSKVGEWRNLVKDLRTVIENKLEAYGMDEFDAEICIDSALKTNQIPAEVRSEFKIVPYVRDYEFSQENIDETLQYINEKIKQFEDAGEDEKNYPPCDISKNSFFCSSLCGFKNGCKYYRDYCETFTKEEDEDDLFG